MPPSSSSLRVGTRGSALALKQTDLAIEALRRAADAPLDVEIVTIKTTGEKFTDRPFEAIGPKGIFAAELQTALVDGRIDVAVHSLKDLMSAEPEGLALAAVLERADARDVVVSRDGSTLAELPPGSVVGTSSVRRRALVAIERPDLVTALLRGNVDTRLRKVADGEVDAAMLAAAGIVRIGREDAITEWLDPETFTPPPGQGAIVIEARTDRADGDLAWVRVCDHAPARAATHAERTFMRIIEGGCDVPLGGWARFEGLDLVCDGFVAAPDGSACLRDRVRGRNPGRVGTELAQRLLDAGAGGLVAQAQEHERT